MCSKLKSIPMMGVSDSETFLSEVKDLNTMEFKILVKPTLDIHHESRITRLEDVKDQEDQASRLANRHDKSEQVQQGEEEEEGDNGKFDRLVVSNLKLRIPPVGELFRVKDEEDKEEDEENGFKTPTSSDQKIPAPLCCPPAPRKPKSVPSTKRKAGRHRQAFLDVSNEIETLFPPVLLEEDLSGGMIIKKVRKGK